MKSLIGPLLEVRGKDNSVTARIIRKIESWVANSFEAGRFEGA